MVAGRVVQIELIQNVMKFYYYGIIIYQSNDTTVST